MSHGAKLWDWACAAYARPDVEPLLLDLQDRGGHSVSYLLWAAWMAGAGFEAPDALLTDGARIARGWDNGVIGPLRQVRRRLRDSQHGDLREQVKAVELEAEHALLGVLEAMAGPAGRPADVVQALDAASRAWGSAEPDGVLASLAKALR